MQYCELFNKFIIRFCGIRWVGLHGQEIKRSHRLLSRRWHRTSIYSVIRARKILSYHKLINIIYSI